MRPHTTPESQRTSPAHEYSARARSVFACGLANAIFSKHRVYLLAANTGTASPTTAPSGSISRCHHSSAGRLQRWWNPDGRDCCRSTWCCREAGQTCLAWGNSPFHSELRTRSPVLAAEGASKVETSRVVAWATPLAALSLRCSHCIWLLGFDRRRSLHESHPMGSVHCGGSVRGSRR